MRRNEFDISDVLGNVIGNWLYDQIVQQEKKEAAIIDRLERIEALLIDLLIDLSASHIRQSRASGTATANGQESGT